MKILSGDLDFVLVCICSLVEDDMMGEPKLLSVSVEIFIWLWSLFVSARLFSEWYGALYFSQFQLAEFLLAQLCFQNFGLDHCVSSEELQSAQTILSPIVVPQELPSGLLWE